MEGDAYLIRHAKAGNRSAWKGQDELRPLSQPGRNQAKGIAERLSSEAIGRVVSSPAVRCVQTVEPLAEHLGLGVEEDGSLEEGAGPDGARRLVLSAEPGSAVALCTHGDVIWQVLSELEDAGVPLTPGVPAKKGSIWVLRVADGAVVRGTYLLPPPS